MPHRPDTWTDALFIYPLYHVNFLTSFMKWFRFFFNGVTVKTENTTDLCKMVETNIVLSINSTYPAASRILCHLAAFQADSK